MPFKSDAQRKAIMVMMSQLRLTKNSIRARSAYKTSWSSKIPVWGKMRKRQHDANVRSDRATLKEQRVNYLEKKGKPSREWSKP